ncbi:low molecular weight protein arginine phosphatase [Brevibacillus laterosporus]|uniref:low molecular weight protein arginine phosphatase n=1 Tax=Brevibacillus laterosporus TaxID=1465 RepID=UPI001EF2FB9A|nr:low molecular weight protein arginine phosphatase [Brevibacillus laterosporus]MCG7315749.1 low molecular weight protein arginine phosphatase [Brevibacillus laterosporus]
MRILFVCTGNTCRSPMAEVLFREQVKDLQMEIASAGVAVFEGHPASLHAQQVLEEKGLAHEHFSKQITNDQINQADLIITMTQGHKIAILSHFPEATEKVYSLKEYAYGQQGDITDPYGGTLEMYRATAKELEEDLQAVREKLQKNVNEKSKEYRQDME